MDEHKVQVGFMLGFHNYPVILRILGFSKARHEEKKIHRIPGDHYSSPNITGFLPLTALSTEVGDQIDGMDG